MTAAVPLKRRDLEPSKRRYLEPSGEEDEKGRQLLSELLSEDMCSQEGCNYHAMNGLKLCIFHVEQQRPQMPMNLSQKGDECNRWHLTIII